MNLQKVSKILLRICGPLFVRRKTKISYSTIRWSEIIDATCSAVIFKDGIRRVDFVFQSIMATRSWFSVVIFGSSPKISILTSSKGLLGGQAHKGLPIQASLVQGAGMRVTDYWVIVSANMWPGELKSHWILHVTPIGVSRHYLIFRYLEDVWSKRFWYHGLCRALPSGSENQDTMMLVREARAVRPDCTCYLSAERDLACLIEVSTSVIVVVSVFRVVSWHSAGSPKEVEWTLVSLQSSVTSVHLVCPFSSLDGLVERGSWPTWQVMHDHLMSILPQWWVVLVTWQGCSCTNYSGNHLYCE